MSTFGLTSPPAHGSATSTNSRSGNKPHHSDDDDDDQFLHEERPPAIGKEDDHTQKSDVDYVKRVEPKTTAIIGKSPESSCMVATKLDPAGGHVVVVVGNEQKSRDEDVTATSPAVTGHHNDGSGSSSNGDGASYLRWAESLKSLLDDSDGVRLFKQFLEQVSTRKLT